jgi:hypothetical protein
MLPFQGLHAQIMSKFFCQTQGKKEQKMLCIRVFYFKKNFECHVDGHTTTSYYYFYKNVYKTLVPLEMETIEVGKNSHHELAQNSEQYAEENILRDHDKLSFKSNDDIQKSIRSISIHHSDLSVGLEGHCDELSPIIMGKEYLIIAETSLEENKLGTESYNDFPNCSRYTLPDREDAHGAPFYTITTAPDFLKNFDSFNNGENLCSINKFTGPPPADLPDDSSENPCSPSTFVEKPEENVDDKYNQFFFENSPQKDIHQLHMEGNPESKEDVKDNLIEKISPQEDIPQICTENNCESKVYDAGLHILLI